MSHLYVKPVDDHYDGMSFGYLDAFLDSASSGVVQSFDDMADYIGLYQAGGAL